MWNLSVILSVLAPELKSRSCAAGSGASVIALEAWAAMLLTSNKCPFLRGFKRKGNIFLTTRTGHNGVEP